ncbi:unnamed protein product [Thlaspi arvense]|uniref:C3H1-type domain-containing protein n=1 Tax=Thlaspi arvense TaxID=13288 RepID=A0AAU9RRM4_THLAR|nr:unnamed protein product [Thlaspi arvense]
MEGARVAVGAGQWTRLVPERPDVPDCMFYLKTGFCGFGARCRFNHSGTVVRCQVVGAMRAGGGEYPERVGQPVCQYYTRTGTCKYGASCKYHHPRQEVDLPSLWHSTFLATHYDRILSYLLRWIQLIMCQGEKECSYYMKTGQCKFGVTCKFHHPQPAGTQVPAPPAGPLPVPAPVPPPAIYPSMQTPSITSSQQYGLVAGNWPVARPTLVPGSYLQGAYSPVLLPPGLHSAHRWGPPAYGIAQFSPSAPAFMGPYLSVPSSAGVGSSSQNEHMFPERPGQPECQYYMKTGDCKFGSSCRYHHPPEWSSLKIFSLSPMGLPLRPDPSLCEGRGRMFWTWTLELLEAYMLLKFRLQLVPSAV